MPAVIVDQKVTGNAIQGDAGVGAGPAAGGGGAGGGRAAGAAPLLELGFRGGADQSFMKLDARG